MPCYHPLLGYRSLSINPSGKRSIVFNKNQGFADMPVELPCGQCIGCRLDRSRQWAIRCVHEASLYENNCFITLTYNDENLPKDNSLCVEHFQLFMKKLRKKYGKGIRYFHCGEYGENFGRPHYHACIFNFSFRDKKVLKTLQDGTKYYVSEQLNELWEYGFTMIGDVTFESAAYVARYITKKITGKNAFEHYNKINYETGEIIAERRPEYVTMSRKPGIGKPWLDKFSKDVYPEDYIVLRGKKLKPPKYYNSQYEKVYPSDYEKIKNRRIVNAKKHSYNNTRDRLTVRETIQKYKFNLLKRNYENEL